MEPTEKTLLKFASRKQQLKIKLCYDPDSKTYLLYQNNFKSSFKKLSAATFAFEDLVFQTFHNQVALAEWVWEEAK